MNGDVVDLLAVLREGTRRGAGREVDLNHPAPSTRGTGDSSGSPGRTQLGFVRHEHGPLTVETPGGPIAYSGRARSHALDALEGDPPHPSPIDSDEAEWWRGEEERLRPEWDAIDLPPLSAERRRKLAASRRRDATRPQPIERLAEQTIEAPAKRKVGAPPKMTDEQIAWALARLDEGARITDLARANWREWDFKTEQSCSMALRRYRRLRDEAKAREEVIAA